MKKSSTLQDIHDNRSELQLIALNVLSTVSLKEIAGDWWHHFEINGKHFDFNVWETTTGHDDEIDVINVTVYTVGWLTDFDAETNTDEYLTVISMPLNKKDRFQLSLS